MNPLDPRGAWLHVDVEQVTAAAACWDLGRTARSSFELRLERLPSGYGYAVFCGLDQVIQYLLDFQIEKERLWMLRNLYWMHTVRKEFWDFLLGLRFTGDLWAAPEGTPVFPGEPVLRLTAPLVEGLFAERYIRSILGYETAVATRAARFADAAQGRAVVERGLALAPAAAAEVLAARAVYCAGGLGTTHAFAAFETGVPIYGGPPPHLAGLFPGEADALRAVHSIFHETATLPLSADDPLGSARIIAEHRLQAKAVELPAGAGDAAALSREVRRILDEAGLDKVKVALGGEFDETQVDRLVRGGAPIDLFYTAGALVHPGLERTPTYAYDLVEIGDKDGGRSPGRPRGAGALPGLKQVYRSFGLDGKARRDLLALADEKQLGAPLLQEWIRDGQSSVSRPGLESIRAYAQKAFSSLPQALRGVEPAGSYRIETSAALQALCTPPPAEPAG